MRTTREAVTFERPFSINAVDGLQPAGTYIVEVDEDLIEGFPSSPGDGSRQPSTCRSGLERWVRFRR